MKNTIQQRLNDNLNRVESLILTYVSLRGKGRGRRGANKTDIMRAAVVLLYASLEDFLRSLARWKLPSEGTTESLNNIPFVGLGSGRPVKVFLGYMVDHKGKTVDDLIAESVESFLDRSIYSNTDEIAALLESIGIDSTTVQSHFSNLADLMTRRHLIVHQVDRDETGGQGNYKIRGGVGEKPVRKWKTAVNDFSTDVLAQL